MKIKVLSMMACMLFASALYADDCYKNLRGETICNNGQSEPHTTQTRAKLLSPKQMSTG